MELLQFQHSVIQTGRIKVCIGLQSRFDILVSETFRYQKDGNIHVDQQACMTVTQIMHPYFLYAGELTATLHFMIEEILGIGEQPVSVFTAHRTAFTGRIGRQSAVPDRIIENG